MLDFEEVTGKKLKATKKAKEVVVIESFDIKPIQKEFEQYKEQLEELTEQAKDLKVIDSETFQIAVDGAGAAKGLIKAITGRWASLSAPFREYITKGNNIVKLFTTPAKNIADEYSRKSGDYQYQIELAEKKRQKAIDEANKALQEKLDKQAKEDGVDKVKVLPVKAPKRETVIHTAGGHSQHLRKDWVGEIVEPKKVPHEYCVPDQKLVNQAVRMGVRDTIDDDGNVIKPGILGVKIYLKVIPINK